MRILALESATRTGSLALVEGDKVVVEQTLDASLQHSEKLMPALVEMLSGRGTPMWVPDKKGGHAGPPLQNALQSIDLFAVDHGPGSFTGLRVGMALMKGIAFASGKPLIGVSSLEALAMNVLPPPPLMGGGEGEGVLVVPMINAHRGEVYTAVYRVGACPKLIEPEQATEPEKWLKYLAEAHRGAALQFIRDSDNPIQAKNIALLAAMEFGRGGSRTAPTLFSMTPRYLRAGV